MMSHNDDFIHQLKNLPTAAEMVKVIHNYCGTLAAASEMCGVPFDSLYSIKVERRTNIRWQTQIKLIVAYIEVQDQLRITGGHAPHRGKDDE